MSDTTFQVGEKVTILDAKKVGEVVEVLDGELYKVEYTDDGGVVQTETYQAAKLGPVEDDEDKSDESEEEEKEGESGE